MSARDDEERRKTSMNVAKPNQAVGDGRFVIQVMSEDGIPRRRSSRENVISVL